MIVHMTPRPEGPVPSRRRGRDLGQGCQDVPSLPPTTHVTRGAVPLLICFWRGGHQVHPKRPSVRVYVCMYPSPEFEQKWHTCADRACMQMARHSARLSPLLSNRALWLCAEYIHTEGVLACKTHTVRSSETPHVHNPIVRKIPAYSTYIDYLYIHTRPMRCVCLRP